MIGIAKHLLQENNITLVIHHALHVTGSPDYSYHHTDHPVGNRVAHLGLYSQCHWIHFGTPHDTGPLVTAEPNYGYSKIAPPAQPNLHTSNTSLNAPDLQLTTSTQPTPQQVLKPTQQQYLHVIPQSSDYIKILPAIPAGANQHSFVLHTSLLSPITATTATTSTNTNSSSTTSTITTNTY
jgi:hypothetical protein